MAEVAPDPYCIHLGIAGRLKHLEESFAPTLRSIMAIIDGTALSIWVECVRERQVGHRVDELPGTDDHV
jgi:hypothetical protein